MYLLTFKVKRWGFTQIDTYVEKETMTIWGVGNPLEWRGQLLKKGTFQ